MKTFTRSAAAASIVLSLAAGAASAATITADYARGNGTYVDITKSSVGRRNDIYAGNFVLDPTNGPDIISFCVDFAHWIADGVTYDVKSLAQSGFSSTVQSRIGSLFSSFYGTLGDSSVQTAAFQVALWEIVDEKPNKSLNLKNGRFRVKNSQIRTLAQQMLDTMGPDTGEWDLTFYDANGNQDQMSATKAPPTGGTVPLPAGLPLMLTAMGGFALARRSLKKA